MHYMIKLMQHYKSSHYFCKSFFRTWIWPVYLRTRFTFLNEKKHDCPSLQFTAACVHAEANNRTFNKSLKHDLHVFGNDNKTTDHWLLFVAITVSLKSHVRLISRKDCGNELVYMCSRKTSSSKQICITPQALTLLQTSSSAMAERSREAWYFFD